MKLPLLIMAVLLISGLSLQAMDRQRRRQALHAHLLAGFQAVDAGQQPPLIRMQMRLHQLQMPNLPAAPHRHNSLKGG